MKSGGSGKGKTTSLVWCLVWGDSVTCQQPTGFSSFCTRRAWRNVQPDRGRGYWQQAVNTVGLFVCVFVFYCAIKPGTRPLQRCSWITSVPWVCRTIQPRQDTSWLTIAALNQYFPPSPAGLFHWQEFKNGQALNEKWGKNVGVDRREGPNAFFQFATIRNRFSTISLN